MKVRADQPTDDDSSLILAMLTPADRAAFRNFDPSRLTVQEQQELKVLLLLRHLEASGVHVSPRRKAISSVHSDGSSGTIFILCFAQISARRASFSSGDR